jgi:hypothetical protein
MIHGLLALFYLLTDTLARKIQNRKAVKHQDYLPNKEKHVLNHHQVK